MKSCWAENNSECLRRSSSRSRFYFNSTAELLTASKMGFFAPTSCRFLLGVSFAVLCREGEEDVNETESCSPTHPLPVSLIQLCSLLVAVDYFVKEQLSCEVSIRLRTINSLQLRILPRQNMNQRFLQPDLVLSKQAAASELLRDPCGSQFACFCVFVLGLPFWVGSKRLGHSLQHHYHHPLLCCGHPSPRGNSESLKRVKRR